MTTPSEPTPEEQAAMLAEIRAAVEAERERCVRKMKDAIHTRAEWHEGHEDDDEAAVCYDECGHMLIEIEAAMREET